MEYKSLISLHHYPPLMRWLAKAALQRTLGALPQGERLNYVFQRHVLHSFPVRDAAYRQKFSRAVNHLALYEEHGPGVPTAEATFFEFGAGWDLAIPLSYALLGVGRQIVIDIRPSARIELVNETMAALDRLRAPDYLRFVREAGFDLVVENPSGPNEEGRAELQAMQLAKRFRSYSLEDVGVTILSFVALAP